MKLFVNDTICSNCGGRCCKTIPGLCIAEDFGEPLIDNIREGIEAGLFAIDWEDDDPIYYIRPATTDTTNAVDPSWGGECVFLRKDGTGCALLPDQRPTECRLVVPNSNQKCKAHTDKESIVGTWLPYQEELRELVENVYTDREPKWEDYEDVSTLLLRALC